MSVKILVLFLLAVTYAESQNNELCPCDAQDNKMLIALLEKLSAENNYVYPGMLSQLGCDCEERKRRKREEVPEVLEELKSGIDASEVEIPEEETAKERERKSIHKNDRRCPEGHVRLGDNCFEILDY